LPLFILRQEIKSSTLTRTVTEMNHSIQSFMWW
jgi:hypothetical protein